MPRTIHGAEKMPARNIAGLALLFVVAAAVQADAPPLEADSRFGFRAVVEGEAFEARFRRYRVSPVLSPARLPLGFEVTIDLGDIDSGDADRDAEMRRPEWFDVARHPTATFSAEQVERATPAGYVAHGELRLKGVARPVAVPFDWVVQGSGVQMTGRVELDRRWFKVGPGDDSSVAAGVEVFFALRWRAP